MSPQAVYNATCGVPSLGLICQPHIQAHIDCGLLIRTNSGARVKTLQHAPDCSTPQVKRNVKSHQPIVLENDAAIRLQNCVLHVEALVHKIERSTQICAHPQSYSLNNLIAMVHCILSKRNLSSGVPWQARTSLCCSPYSHTCQAPPKYIPQNI